MVLTEKQKKYLRGLAHSLKPVVIVAEKGLSENVMTEIDEALTFHELIKVRIRLADRSLRREKAEAIEAQSKSFLIGMVGGIAIYFRRNAQKPKIKLKLNK